MSDQFGRMLCYHLRHNPEAIDKEGWADLNRLRQLTEVFFTLEDIQKEVNLDKKQRYTLDVSNNRIRCNQGHSVDVDLSMQTKTPPKYLYHGTSKKAMECIKTEGIKPMSRNHVHLSADTETAENVGGRGKRGEPVILRIRAQDMMSELGTKFYISQNSVWLTESVIPFEYTEVWYVA